MEGPVASFVAETSGFVDKEDRSIRFVEEDHIKDEDEEIAKDKGEEIVKEKEKIFRRRMALSVGIGAAVGVALALGYPGKIW